MSIRVPRRGRAVLGALLFAGFMVPAGAAIPAAERAALVALYGATDGDASWTNKTGWNGAPGSECAWFGIACDATGEHVTRIQLQGNRLTGTLPDLSALASLRQFYVFNNELTGPIPDMSALTQLQRFNARTNNLTGPIPDLSALASLVSFNVSDNDLIGPIPNLSALPSLRLFQAGQNQLTGPIPDLSPMTALEDFRVSFNQLTGPIPDVSGLGALKVFDVGSNQLTGTPSAPPAGLLAGQSRLCPNFLQGPSPDDGRWAAATEDPVWPAGCEAPGALFAVTPIAGPNGGIWPGTPQTSVVSGASTSLIITADDGYLIDSIGGTCGGTPAVSGNSTVYLTDPIGSDCTVTARFKAKPVVVVAPVPTLGEWAMLLLGLILAGWGAHQARTRGRP